MDTTIFAQRLKEARTAAKLTQAELCKMSGVTAATISAYESADGNKGKNPSLDNALKLAQALGISLDWLCGSIVSKPQVQITDFLKILVKLDENITPVSVDRVEFANAEIQKQILPDAYDLISLGDWIEAQSIANDINEEFSYLLYPISFNDWRINGFLQKWENMRKLYHNRTIDKDLYEIWLEKQYAEIDKKQKQDEEFYNELMNADTNTEDKATQGGGTDVNNP